ncbi:MAG TPA: hypothetical protein PLD73_18480, partial [Candidatus Hydrogenedentes bacterium]|nr:hypothetical protein [Candidatus Hydrogenedentota bacterium]
YPGTLWKLRVPFFNGKPKGWRWRCVKVVAKRAISRRPATPAGSAGRFEAKDLSSQPAEIEKRRWV